MTWRHSADHVGWAALPPSARFISGVGFRHWNNPRGAGSEVALQPSHYTFIPTEHLADTAPYRYAIPAGQLNKVYNQSTVLNNITVEHNKIINHGIDPKEVAAASGTEVRRVEVRELPGNGDGVAHPDHLARSGNTLVIYRSQAPSQPVPKPLPNMNLAAVPSAQKDADPRVTGRESYPPGSLVIIGSKNASSVSPNTYAPLPNMNLSHRPAAQSAAYQNAESAGPYPQADYQDARTVTPTGEIQPTVQPYQQTAPGTQPFAPGWQQPNRFYPQAGRPQSPQVIVIPSRYTAAQALANHPQYNRAPEQAPWQFHSAPVAAPTPEYRSVAVEAPRPAVVEHSAPAPVSHSAPSSSASSSAKK